MAYSLQEVSSDGTLSLLSVGLNYFDRSEIKVYFDGVEDALPWAWVGTSDKLISFDPAVPDGVVVLLKRVSSLEDIRHSLTGGAQFTDEVMDENFIQVLRIAQEAVEQTGQGAIDIAQNALDVATALESAVEDAVAEVAGIRDDVIAQTSGYADAASASADSAEGAANAAAASAASAESFAGRATVVALSGDGVTTAFELGVTPLTKNNTQVYIGSVYQRKSTYTTSGTSLVFTAPPPFGSTIEVVVFENALSLGSLAAQDASNVNITGGSISGVAGSFTTLSASTGLNVTGTGGVLASLDGSGSVTSGAWYGVSNTAKDRFVIHQLNAANGLDSWVYNGSSWSKVQTLDSTGLSVAGALSAGGKVSCSTSPGTGGFAINRRDTGGNAFEMYSSAGNWQLFSHSAVADVLTYAPGTGLSVTGGLTTTGPVSFGSNLLATQALLTQTNAQNGQTLTFGNAYNYNADGAGSVINASGALYLRANGNEVTLDDNGNLLVGLVSSSIKLHVRSRGASQGTSMGDIDNGSFSSIKAFSVANYGANAAACSVGIGSNTSTGRSINAGGTINASGADYAEYERNNGLKISKGSIVGFKADGTLTLTYREAIRFGVKSTDPSYVGGDVWGSEDQVGKRPQEPIYTAPVYQGAPHPGEKPAAPVLSLPDQPSQQQGESDDTYAVRLAHWQELVVNTQAAYDKSLAAHEQAMADWDAAFAAWQADDDKHRAAVIAAESAHRLRVDQFESDKIVFEQKLEAARQLVDRIAYSGKVPVNVTGAAPGGYIIAAEDEAGEIIGEFVADPDFAQYKKAVGRVNRILEDGRCEVAVIVH